MKIEVDKPENCPLTDKDELRVANGCKLGDMISCWDDNRFPDDCPLKDGTVEVVLKS